MRRFKDAAQKESSLIMVSEETGDIMTKKADGLFDITNEVFSLEVEEKSKYIWDASEGIFAGPVTYALMNWELLLASIDKLQRPLSEPR